MLTLLDYVALLKNNEQTCWQKSHDKTSVNIYHSLHLHKYSITGTDKMTTLQKRKYELAMACCKR